MEEHARRMRRRGARLQFFMRRHDCMVHGTAMSSLRLGTLGARPAPQSPQVSAKESKVEKHEPKDKKRYARLQLSARRRDYMMHGQGVSSLRLGTLGARPPPQSPLLAAKESKVEKHEPKNKKRYAHSQLSTRRRDCMMHGQGVRPLRLGTLGARPPSPPHQVSAKESNMENTENQNKKEDTASSLG